MGDGSTPPPAVVARAGGQEARIGDDLQIRMGSPFSFGIDVAAPQYKNGRVDFVWNGEAVASSIVPETGHVDFERFANSSGYVRVHVFKADGTPLAVTNPILVTMSGQR